MLRAIVGNFLDSLSEREFDAPLLAILASQGFYDIHFIHGSFEFGKDVIAKKLDDDTGEIHQYSIQSKAGDIGLPGWREVRPQVEECAHNTRAHPSFDEKLPRVAVLVTTGRLVGAAAIDAQEYKQSREARGFGPFETWDRETLLNWLCLEPTLGLTATEVQDDLLSLVSDIRRGIVTEPMLERFSRGWLVGEVKARRRAQASIQASILCNSLRLTQRLDLAALLALHLHRASWTDLIGDEATRSPESDAAVRLFVSYASEVLEQVEPLLSDPLELVRPLLSIASMVSYPAACLRLVELLGLLALEADGELSARASSAVVELCADHPGSWRPPTDQFAVSLIPPVVVLARRNCAAASTYLRAVADWLLDRHDPNLNGLGLASLDDDEEVAAERLLGGSLERTKLERRRASYIAVVVLDLLIAVGNEELYDAVRENIAALQIIPCTNAANEIEGEWRRGGNGIWPHPRVDYAAPGAARPTHHSQPVPVPSSDALLLTAVCRNRHYPVAINQLLESNGT